MRAIRRCTWCKNYCQASIDRPEDLRASFYCPVCALAGYDTARHAPPGRAPSDPVDPIQDSQLRGPLGIERKAKGWSH